MVNFNKKSHYSFEDLQKLVAFLRSEDGCPWDHAQTHASIRRNLLEEAYEACEGIDLDDAALMQEEFGDVLLQAVFHVSIEEDLGRSSMQDVIDGVCNKLIFRHPHLFAGMKTEDWDWEKMKQQEKGTETQTEVLNGVARSLPALIRAEKLQNKLMKMGFDWESPEHAAAYAQKALENGDAAELGKALFAIAGACKKLGIDPEQVLHDTCEAMISDFSEKEKNGFDGKEIRQFLP